MDLGDGSHILLTPRMAEDLRKLSDEYRDTIKPVHDFVLKHGQTILVYSCHGEGFGNPKHPLKGEHTRSRYGEEAIKLQKTTIYPRLDVELRVLDPQKMLVRHKRTYEIVDTSDELIYEVWHGIATDVEEYSINDLNLQIYDENDKELKITGINVDTPYTKEFTTKFNEPL